MKRVAMLFVVLLTALAFGFGCATLGWKPSEDQLIQYESNLMVANSVETGAFLVFDTLCASSVLNPTQCADGYAADTEWDNAYALAMGAIADYRAGKSEAEMMQKYVREAISAGVRIVALIKKIISEKSSTLAAKVRGKAMAKPPGITLKK